MYLVLKITLKKNLTVYVGTKKEKVNKNKKK